MDLSSAYKVRAVLASFQTPDKGLAEAEIRVGYHDTEPEHPENELCNFGDSSSIEVGTLRVPCLRIVTGDSVTVMKPGINQRFDLDHLQVEVLSPFDVAGEQGLRLCNLCEVTNDYKFR